MKTLSFPVSGLLRDRSRAIVIAFSLLLCASFQLQAQSHDFGDAPDSYGTLLSSNGPRHAGFTPVYLGGSLGSSIDTEPDGLPGTMADGDDSHDQHGTIAVYNRSDEDCLMNGFPAVCLLRNIYSLRVTVYNNSGTDATVSAWIDLNQNGVFDAMERTQVVVPTTPNLIHYNGTPVTLIWKMNGINEGWTYARVRVANNASEVKNPTGLASSGEVEDYRVQMKNEYDFGDAPESYGTLLKDNGPRHLLNGYLNFSSISMSSIAPCTEDDGKPSLLADADDAKQDEDDIVLPALTTTAESYSAVVSVFNLSGRKATISGWIDFNKNGLFDSGERTQATIPTDMRGYITLKWSGISGLTPGRTYARFRIASQAKDVSSPTGYADSGEVQDYSLMIGQAALPVELVSFQGEWIENKGNNLTWATAWEKDNAHFDIQRSTDAKNFETISRITDTGNGTTSTMHSYAYIDTQDSQDVLYYRLKQVDLDGKVNYSKVIALRHITDIGLKLVVYPNPVVEQLSVKLSTSQPVGIRVYSVNGAQVLAQEGAVESVDVRSLPAGLYVIEVRTLSGPALRQRFVKQ